MGLLLLAATGLTRADESYRVDVQVYDNGRLVAAPVMMVAGGKQASLSLGDDFSLSLLVEQSDAGQSLDVASQLALNGENYTPRMRVRAGKESAIGIGNMRMFIKVTAAP